MDTWQVSHVRAHAACFAHLAASIVVNEVPGGALLPILACLISFHWRCASVQGLLMHLELALVASDHGNSAAQSTYVPSASLAESVHVSELVTLFTHTWLGLGFRLG